MSKACARLKPPFRWVAEKALPAESFSGPFAFHLFQDKAIRAQGLVFAASFIERPSPLLNLLPDLSVRPFMRSTFPPPKILIRKTMLNGCMDETLVTEVHQALIACPPDLVMDRMVKALRCPLPPHSTEKPVLYLEATHDRLVSRRCAEAIRLRSYAKTNPHYLYY